MGLLTVSAVWWDTNGGGTITASYAIGSADGGAGNIDSVGSLLGANNTGGIFTASYGFGMVIGDERMVRNRQQHPAQAHRWR